MWKLIYSSVRLKHFTVWRTKLPACYLEYLPSSFSALAFPVNLLSSFLVTKVLQKRTRLFSQSQQTQGSEHEKVLLADAKRGKTLVRKSWSLLRLLIGWMDTRFITQSHSLCVVAAASPFSDFFFRRVGGGWTPAFSRKTTEMMLSHMDSNINAYTTTGEISAICLA